MDEIVSLDEITSFLPQAAEKAEKLLRKKADAPGKGRAKDVKAVRDVAAAAVGLTKKPGKNNCYI